MDRQTIFVNPNKTFLQTICTLIGGLLLLQSCQIYDKGTVSLEEASQTGLRAKITTVEEEKLQYERIITEQQQYFGLKKSNGNLVKYPITEDTIKSLRLQNKKKSAWVTVGLGLGVSVLIAVIAAKNTTYTAPSSLFVFVY